MYIDHVVPILGFQLVAIYLRLSLDLLGAIAHHWHQLRYPLHRLCVFRCSGKDRYRL